MNKKITLLIVLLASLFIAGCSAFGPNPSPPTAPEQALFTIQTNYVNRVTQQTNFVSLTNAVVVTQTNGVQLTNIVSQVVPTVTSVTQAVPAYTLTPGAGAQQAAQLAGSIGNTVMPGVGSLVSMAVLAAFGFWGHLRSYKQGQTAQTMTATTDALTQEMETVLEFVKALPNGSTYATALTNFLQAHQMEAGVLNQVATALKSEVSNSDAKMAASEVIATLNSLQALPTPLAKPTA